MITKDSPSTNEVWYDVDREALFVVTWAKVPGFIFFNVDCEGTTKIIAWCDWPRDWVYIGEFGA